MIDLLATSSRRRLTITFGLTARRKVYFYSSLSQCSARQAFVRHQRYAPFKLILYPRQAKVTSAGPTLLTLVCRYSLLMMTLIDGRSISPLPTCFIYHSRHKAAQLKII